jgi:hypothetical protein
MINSYCGSLKDTFAQLVYYGILDKRDAQCFRVETSVESGSYVLAVAAILLALLNTFVMNAVLQFFRDKDAEAETSVGDIFPDGTDEMDLSDAMKSIKPVPVLFTDRFRWFLNREDAVLSR